MIANPFARLIELQTAFTEADNKLAAIEAEIQPKVAAVVESQKTAWTDARAQRDEAEREIRALAERHPEWMDGQSIKTPFGSIQFRDSKKLEIPNPDATVALIRHLVTDEKLRDLALKVQVDPRVEVLETFETSFLAKLGVNRVATTSITVKPAKVDMAKEAGKKGKKAEKAPAE